MGKLQLSLLNSNDTANVNRLQTLLSLSITVSYALIVIGFSLLLQTLLRTNNTLVLGVLVLGFAILLFPLHQLLEKRLNTVFQQPTEAYQENLKEFAVALTNLQTPVAIAEVLCEQISNALNPASVFVYLFDEDKQVFASVATNHPTMNTEVTFSPQSELVSILEEQESVFIDLTDIPPVLSAVQAKIKLIDCNLFIALPGRQAGQLSGWVALSHSAEEAFSPSQLNFLQTVSHQSAIAIERNSVVENLENRLREMDVLRIISEGVNLTLELNDILELVYFQTSKIIPSSEFIIQLYDADIQGFLNLFVVKDNNRITAEENIFVPAISSLQQIISTGDTLTATNFRLEIDPDSKDDVYAWMGTPLKTSDATIGVMSIATRDPAMTFTFTQRRMFESIAGQASGAIIKTRLIDETNQRAKQFSALNEVTQQITSTFNVDFLLHTIVERAEAMLDCEASSLLLFDEERENLYFRVVTGPVADQLRNKPIEKGSGFAWQTVSEKKSIINNRILTTDAWNQQVDASTGFETKSMLTAPLISQGEVIGVIETINKINGQPFTEVDREILQAFAGQAAIAIENAELYTQTDQALSERVEELSIMQNIDRELNTSLDIARAMQITLDHAMMRSHADAAFIGSVNVPERTITIMSSESYPEEASLPQQEILSINHYPNIQNILETGKAQSIAIENDQESILPNCQRQTIIPINRENAPIGVIILEMLEADPIDEETIEFLTRLSDHASIAIANADLYSQVQSANIAKSEFVSFVSHELKNPMTSIKGYTDLLLAKAVGPVTEAQDNFLNTIRSNVERMNVLVSDLSDVSRIEAGRLRLDFAKLDLKKLMDEVIRSQSALVERKEQQLLIEIEENLPPIWADRYRVVQIITNLISNANKYTGQNGIVTFTAEQSPNIWDAEGAPNVVHISVKDNGMGISAEDQAMIFQKFFRTESAKSSDMPGTGLGLNITKNLVEMQGGTIWFESALGEGTTFHVTFPVAD